VSIPAPLRRHLWLLLPLAGLLLFGDRLLLSSPEPGRLRFAHTFTAASERAILDDAVAEFEALHPDVKIEQVVSSSEVYGDIGWRLQFQRRVQPDIYFQWDGFKVDVAVARGWALDLRPHLSAEFKEAFVPAALATPGAEDPGVYLLPHSVDLCNLVWYDRDTFQALGFSPPRTLEEWLAQCEQLRRAGKLPLAQGNRDLWPMGNMAAELVAQDLGPAKVAGLYRPGSPVSPEELGGLEALVRLRDARCFELEGVVGPRGIGGIGDDDAKILFLSGKAVQHVVGSWLLADVMDAREKGELGFEIDFFPLPSPAGKPDALGAVKTGYMVNPASANVPAAVAFLELLLSRKYQQRFAALGALSLRKDAVEFSEDPLTRRMLQTLAGTGAIVAPSDTGFAPDQADVAYRTVSKLLLGDLKDVDAAARFWSEQKALLARKGL
jgi:raffinose/stachyose/melibiose transport system substrate-binding protein